MPPPRWAYPRLCPAAVTNSNTPNPLSGVLSMLATAIGGSAATTQSTKNATAGISSILGNTAAFTGLVNSHTTNNAGTQPKAFLNIVFFDERFNFVSEGSTKLRVTTAGNHTTPIVLSNIKVPRNGYCFVYVSNEGPTNVFFDDLQVQHDRGRIIEENHYYTYGLKIAALSSKAFGGAPNNYQYQGDYSEFDDDLGWNDFMLRSYDAQIGRFLQHDPYDQFASGYVGMGNDPGNMVDPTGGWGQGCTGGGKAPGMFLNMLGKVMTTAGTVAGMANAAMRIMAIAGSVSRNRLLGSGGGSTSDASKPWGNGGEVVEEGGNKDGCPDCPVGYAKTPSSIKSFFNQLPFYTTEYDVVTFYALMVNTIVGKEYSGLIYFNKARLKSGARVKMYSITGFETTPGNPLQAPGPDGLKHLLPKGAVPVAHIHNHYQGLGWENKSFSGTTVYGNGIVGDRSAGGLLGDKYRWANLNYWVLGSTGYLSIRYADNTPAPINSSSGGDAGQIIEFTNGDNFYTNPPNMPPCPCYKVN